MKQKLMILHSFLITALLLGLSTLLGAFYFHYNNKNMMNISLIYVLALLIISRYTNGYFYGVFASIISVICVNFFYTFPYWQLNFNLNGYPITFVGMLIVSLSTCTITTRMKIQARTIAEREKLVADAEKEKMRANLLRAISHDLRTPLTSIMGASSSYLDHYDSFNDTERKNLVSNIYEDSNWLLNMVENLLSVTRISNQETSVATSLEAVEEVVSESVMRLKKRISGADIQVKVPDEFLMIPMDAMLIEQVLINLMENAIIHANSTEPIDLYVEDSKDYAIFHVRDYGTPIPEDRLPTIFSGTSSGYSDCKKGMGIGLSICKTIILAHKGTLEAKNHSDGTEFYFTLPKEEYTHENKINSTHH